MSSLDSAVASALSGLNAQGASISVISQNIANADTTAYKSSQTNFSSLVTGSGATASGVVTSNNTADLTSQGSITATGVSTNLAIQGGGFFVVTDNTANQTSGFDYSRNGDFTIDKNGFLVNNEGEFLLGQQTNSTGTVLASGTNSLTSLTPVFVNAALGAAKATSQLAFGANLPADAAPGAIFTTSTEIFDAEGISSTLNETWTNNGANSWNLTFSNPVRTSDQTGGSSGLITPTSIDLTFNGDGTIASASVTGSGVVQNTANTPISIPLAIDWTTAGGATNATNATPSTIALSLGTVGQSNELTQYASTSVPINVSVSGMPQDGLPPGKLTGITVTATGLVTATFDTGLKEPVYQLALGTFKNENGLTLSGGTVYSASVTSGAVILADPGSGAAGSIESSALEASNADTTAELSALVTAQQAYNASAKVIGTVGTMFSSLLQAIA